MQIKSYSNIFCPTPAALWKFAAGILTNENNYALSGKWNIPDTGKANYITNASDPTIVLGLQEPYADPIVVLAMIQYNVARYTTQMQYWERSETKADHFVLKNIETGKLLYANKWGMSVGKERSESITTPGPGGNGTEDGLIPETIKKGT